MTKYYITFKCFYVVVIADRPEDAVKIFQMEYPDMVSGVFSCYTEALWNAVYDTAQYVCADILPKMEVLKLFSEEYPYDSFTFSWKENCDFMIIDKDFSLKQFNDWIKQNNLCDPLQEAIGLEYLNDTCEESFINYLSDDNWGYSDKFEFCDNCGDPIPLQDDHFLVNYEECSILCSCCANRT